MFRNIRRLTGAALVVAAAVSAAACMGPRESEEELASDRSVVDQVKAQLNADQTLYSRHITVQARDGVVTLDGYAWSTEELEAAAQDAQSAPGVTRVVNNIQVDRGAIQDSGVAR